MENSAPIIFKNTNVSLGIENDSGSERNIKLFSDDNKSHIEIGTTNKNEADNDRIVKTIVLGSKGGTVTIPGKLVVQGDTTEIETENLLVKDKIIEIASGNEDPLNDYAGFVVPNYNGEDYGAMVIDNHGEFRIGKIGFKDGEVSKYGDDDNDTQPVMTRDEKGKMADGQFLIWSKDRKRAITKAPTDVGFTYDNLTDIIKPQDVEVYDGDVKIDTYSPTDKDDQGKREIHIAKNMFITKDGSKLAISSKDTKYIAGTSLELVEQDKIDKETDTYKIDVQFSATGEAGKAVESSDKRVVNALDRTGDAMTGDLSMGNHSIHTDNIVTSSKVDQSPVDLVSYSETGDGRVVSVGNAKAITKLNSKNAVHVEVPIDMRDNKIGNLADPVDNRDATHKGYVDSEIESAVADMEAYTDKYTYYVKDDSTEKVEHNVDNQYIFDISHKSNKLDVQETFEKLNDLSVLDNINQELLSYNPYSTNDKKIKLNNNLKVTQSADSITVDAIDHLYVSGTGLSKSDGANYTSTFNLKAAVDSELGGIKTGYSTDNAGRKYAIQLDEANKGFVNVP